MLTQQPKDQLESKHKQKKETMNMNKQLKKTPWPLVRKRTIAIERQPLVREVSANFCG
jgi:hypothetical protein